MHFSIAALGPSAISRALSRTLMMGRLYCADSSGTREGLWASHTMS